MCNGQRYFGDKCIKSRFVYCRVHHLNPNCLSINSAIISMRLCLMVPYGFTALPAKSPHTEQRHEYKFY